MYYMDVIPELTRLESVGLIVFDGPNHANVGFAFTLMDPRQCIKLLVGSRSPRAPEMIAPIAPA